MNRPLLSIVIANYNYGRFLEEAIQSVANQEGVEKVELIICDALSTDNSVDIIKKYANELPPNTSYFEWIKKHPSYHIRRSLITWWCSEKDCGQSAAFNKGFSHARGEWLTWLNADDLLMPRTVARVAKFVAKHPSAEWVTGNKLTFDSSSRKILQVNWGPHCQPPFARRNHSFNAVFGPTTFWKKSLYEHIGPIDENLHYAMDTEYWARITMSGVKQYRLNHICWGFRKHEESKTAGIQTHDVTLEREREREYWLRKTGYRLHKCWYYYWFVWRLVDLSWMMRVLMKIRYEGRFLDSLLFSI